MCVHARNTLILSHVSNTMSAIQCQQYSPSMCTRGINAYLHPHTYPVSLQTLLALHIFEAKLADVYDRLLGEFLWVRREVPRLHPVPSQFHHVDVLHPGDDIIRAVSRPTPRRLLLEATSSQGRGRQGRKWGGTAFC